MAVEVIAIETINAVKSFNAVIKKLLCGGLLSSSFFFFLFGKAFVKEVGENHRAIKLGPIYSALDDKKQQSCLLSMRSAVLLSDTWLLWERQPWGVVLESVQ